MKTGRRYSTDLQTFIVSYFSTKRLKCKQPLKAMVIAHKNLYTFDCSSVLVEMTSRQNNNRTGIRYNHG